MLKKEQERLSSAEAVELRNLTHERIQFEAEVLRISTDRITQSTEQAQQPTQKTIAQSRELEELIREQRSYLAEVNTIIKEMELRRRGWRTRYKKVAGRPLTEPISPGGILQK